jgi:glycine cleavage system H protein
MYPEDLLYTADHEWVRVNGDSAEVGITSFAQEALGDIVYVSLPAPGAVVTAGSSCGEIESTKSVSDIYAPMDGEVVECNTSLDSAPETVNGDPYGSGWLFRLRLNEPGQASALMSSAQYQAQLDSA